MMGFLIFYVASVVFFYFVMRFSIRYDMKMNRKYPYMDSVGTIFAMFLPVINALGGILFLITTLIEMSVDKSKGKKSVRRFFIGGDKK